MQIPSAPSPPLRPFSDQLVLFPFLSWPVDPAGSGWAAGMEQSPLGEDRCKSSGFRMKRSCFE